MRFAAFIFAVITFLPSHSNACSIPKSPTESMELVTIKFMNTYFQLPEAAFEHSFQRSPRDVKLFFYIERLKGPSGDFAVMLDRKEAMPHTYQNRINETPFNDEIVIIGTTSYNITEDNIAYLKTLSSKTPPPTWEKDFAIASKFNLGQDPCLNWPSPSRKGEEIKKPLYNRADIQEGLQHRNQAIRAAAADALSNDNAPLSKEEQDLLVRLAHDDPEVEVRQSAVEALGHIAKTNPSVISDIKEIMKKDNNDWVRRTAEGNLKLLQE